MELGKVSSGNIANDNHTSKYLRLLTFLKDIVIPQTPIEDFPLVLIADPDETAAPGSSQEEESYTSDAQSPRESLESLAAFPMEFQDTPSHSEEKETHNNRNACSASFLSYDQSRKVADKKLKSDDYNQNLLDIERQKLQYLMDKSARNQNRQEDEDWMFFKSLLTHVRKIPDPKKMAFRNRIQEAVEQFAYPSPAVSSTQTSHTEPVITTPHTIKVHSSKPSYDEENVTITHTKVRSDT